MGTLLNIIGDYSQNKLRREEITLRSNMAEMRLRAQVSQLEQYGLDTFVRELTEWLENTSAGNSNNMWIYYKVEREGSKAEIWHLNVNGDKDRLVMLLHEENPITEIDITRA